MDPRTFVLLHGSWHDGRAWDQVAELLRAEGHAVHAPTLAGHGPGGDRSVGVSDVVDALERYVHDNSLSDFVLVGHSFSGLVMQALTQRVPERVRLVVFASAFVLRDGESLTDNLPPYFGEILGSSLDPDGGVPIGFDMFRGMISDGSPELAAQVYATLSPSPRRCWTDRVSLPTFFELAIPKAYVLFSDDGGPSGDQHPEFHFHPRHSSRLGEHRFVTVPGSHEAMYTNPAGVAKVLLTLTN